MSTSTALVPSWGEPSPWTGQGRELAQIKRKAGAESQRNLAQAEVAEFSAQLRKRYVENRLYDAADVMTLAVSLSKGDQLLLSGLMEIAGAYLRSENQAMRRTFD